MNETVRELVAPSASVDVRALRAYRLSRVRRSLHERGLPAVLLYDPINIRYATDTPNMQVWTLHNPARYAFVPADGPVVLFDFHGCAHISRGIETVDEVRPATAWYYFAAGPKVSERAERWAAEIADLLAATAGGERRLAVDRLDPAGIDALRRHNIRLANGQALMESARLVKSADEIAAMRISMAVCEAGMDAMRVACRPGITENELWSELHRVNIARGGEWIETRLLSSGPKSNPWFQECGDRVIEADDLIAFDTDLIGPYGYCSDISRAWTCAGTRPSDDRRRLYATAFEQISRTIERLRPGVSFREIAETGGDIADIYRSQRYSVVAHGIGLCDEYPHIAYPEDFDAHGYDGHLVAGMTLCVESYIGEVGGPEGVKLEEQVMITDAGAQPISTYPFETDLL